MKTIIHNFHATVPDPGMYIGSPRELVNTAAGKQPEKPEKNMFMQIVVTENAATITDWGMKIDGFSIQPVWFKQSDLERELQKALKRLNLRFDLPTNDGISFDYIIADEVINMPKH